MLDQLSTGATGSLGVGEEERARANAQALRHLQDAFVEGRRDLAALRAKLSISYIVIVVLSILMFLVGIALLSVPAIAALRGQIGDLQSLIAGGFGIADLAALFLFRPIERINALMGDMSQLIVAINSYQTQVSLRLLEMRLDDRPTVGRAAESIGKAATECVKTIQDYYESTRVRA